MEFLKNETRTPNPRNSSNFVSRFLLSYLNSTFSNGFKRPLTKSDVFELNVEDSSEILSNRLRKKWQEEISGCRERDKNPSLFKAILKMAACRIFFMTIMMLFLGLLKIGQAFLLQMLLKDVAKPQFWERYEVYYWAIGLFGAIILTWMFLHNSLLAADVLGVNMKSAVLGLLFEKTLRIGESGLNGITSGHIIALFSTDVQKIQEMFRLIYYIAITPILLLASTYILWRELGPSCLAGIGVMLVLIPLQVIAGRVIRYLRGRTGEKTEKRVSIMNEIISSMQITKMFTWEDSYANLVKSIRRDESSKIMSGQLMRAFNNVMYSGSPYISGLATFVTFYLYGPSNLTVSLVAGTMSIFFLIRLEVTHYFSLAFQGLFEGKTSCQRIQNYLLQCEIESLNDGTSCTKRTPSLSFDNIFATWTKGELEPAVKGVSFNANMKNNLVMVVGAVGSGKTALLKTILNELVIQKGKVQRTGSLAYSAQQPWIFSGTIRQNILFGKQFKKPFYEKVITACALAPDFAQLDKGDLTLIGDRGVQLTTGQKTRISLARAIYSDADIYLLDDPLNSVDVKIARHIFERCVQGLLKKKITILVTHHLQYLEHANRIIFLQRDSQCEEGTFEELTNRGISLLSLLRSKPDEKLSDVDSAIETDDYLQYRHTEEKSSGLDLTGISLNVKKDSIAAEARSSIRSLQSSIYDEENHHDNENGEENAERIARGGIPAKLYLKYFVDGIGWLSTFFLFIAVMVGQVMMTLADVWLFEWALGEEQRASSKQITAKFYSERHLNHNMYAFIVLACLAFLGNVTRLMAFFAAVVKCSRRLHDRMFEAILNAPIYFFDTNPIGQITNRFSKDVYLLDEGLPSTFNDMIQFFFFSLVIIVLNCISVPYLLIVLLLISIIFFLLQFYFLRSSRQLRRLEAISRIPLYTHLACTLDGLTTIRSFQLNRKISNEFYACADHQAEGCLMYIYAMRWFALRLDIIALIFSLCSIFAPLLVARFVEIDEVLIGVSLTYVLLLSGMLNWCVYQSIEVDNLMTSVEREYEYANLEPELDDGVNKDLRESWPEYGLLTCESVSFSDHSSLPYVLRRLCLCVRPYEKIGVVGRTGSGKSSFINMLLRMGNTNGIIRIDGYPIHQLKLKNLRQAISVIPQDPVLFSGTIRRNLDPFLKFFDGDIWEALEEVQMNETIMNYKHKLDTEITDSGSNLSIGERQLLCLARALLHKNKFLLVDEATSNVDLETDALMQRIIRDKFKECTVITIAHRLNTIMHSDRIMMLEGGKVVEFDEPSTLLKNTDGYFRKLVDQAGRNEANRLESLAEESKHLRHLMLLQTQVAHPGSHITVSKTKAELIRYFGTQVVYETNV